VTSVRSSRLRGWAAAGATFSAALGLLLVRPELQRLGTGPLLLAALGAAYLLIGAGSLAAPIPAIQETPPLGQAIVFLVGLAAVLLATTTAGRPVPLPVVGAAPILNTMAAIAEEALFRRLLYGWARLLGTLVAVVVSALAFALIHVPLYGIAVLPVDLGAGLLLSWQRWASGSWTAPAATHVAANLLALAR
jgi:membrane protease YdiL (CAAX protease family)